MTLPAANAQDDVQHSAFDSTFGAAILSGNSEVKRSGDAVELGLELGLFLIAIAMWGWWWFAMFSDSSLGEFFRIDPPHTWRTRGIDFQNFTGASVLGVAALLTVAATASTVDVEAIDALDLPAFVAMALKLVLFAVFLLGVAGVPLVLIGLFWPTDLPWWARPDKRWLRRQEAKLDSKKQAAATARQPRRFTSEQTLRADQLSAHRSAKSSRERRILTPGLGGAAAPFWKLFALGLAVYFARYLYRWALSDAGATRADTIHFCVAGAVYLAAAYYFLFRFRTRRKHVVDPRRKCYEQLSVQARSYYDELPHAYDYYVSHPHVLDQSLLTLQQLAILEMSDAEVKDMVQSTSPFTTTPGQLAVTVVLCVVLFVVLCLAPLAGFNVLEEMWLLGYDESF